MLRPSSVMFTAPAASSTACTAQNMVASTAASTSMGWILAAGFNDSYAKNTFPTRKRRHTNADTHIAATRRCSYGAWWLHRHH